jgi:hypothetical protein
VRDLALDPTAGDLSLPRSADGLRRASLTSGAAAVRQKLHLRLGLIAGEYPFDVTAGIPLFSGVLGKVSGLAVAEATYRRAVASCPGVGAIETWRFAVGRDRRATVTFRVTTTGGAPVDVRDFVAGGGTQ